MVDVGFSVLLLGHSVCDSVHAVFKLMTTLLCYLKYSQC